MPPVEIKERVILPDTKISYNKITNKVEVSNLPEELDESELISLINCLIRLQTFFDSAYGKIDWNMKENKNGRTRCLHTS